MDLEAFQKTPVADDETLARFILRKEWLKTEHGKIRAKADAFIPYKHVELSVTRHKHLSVEELWGLGEDVARLRNQSFLGRADLSAAKVRQQPLNIVPDAPPRNHANITAWPADKPSQKIIALELAAGSGFVGR